MENDAERDDSKRTERVRCELLAKAFSSFGCGVRIGKKSTRTMQGFARARYLRRAGNTEAG
jgi:hypothetical protein